MVSHRLASLRGADRIFVLDEGTLVEQGTPEALLEAGGLYATMHDQQQRGSPVITGHTWRRGLACATNMMPVKWFFPCAENASISYA